jgi:hypothetical protein
MKRSHPEDPAATTAEVQRQGSTNMENQDGTMRFHAEQHPATSAATLRAAKVNLDETLALVGEK